MSTTHSSGTSHRPYWHPHSLFDLWLFAENIFLLIYVKWAVMNIAPTFTDTQTSAGREMSFHNGLMTWVDVVLQENTQETLNQT